MQGAQSENESKQEIQQLYKELADTQELAKTSKQKCFELQGEMEDSSESVEYPRKPK